MSGEAIVEINIAENLHIIQDRINKVKIDSKKHFRM
jgi:hypothetical protein